MKPSTQHVLKESGFVSHVLKQKTQCDKLNVAALGNMVKQLHIHHVARFTHDVAWPKPVWGNQPACPYHIEKASVLISTYRESLALFIELASLTLIYSTFLQGCKKVVAFNKGVCL